MKIAQTLMAFTLFFVPLVFNKAWAKDNNSVFVQDTNSNAHSGATSSDPQLDAIVLQNEATQVSSRQLNTLQSGKKGSLGNYKKNHFNLYAIKDDIALGTQVQKEQFREFNKKKIAINPPEQAALKARIEKIVSKLARVSDRPNLPYEVHIFDKKDIVNAFCLPGGKIGIFTGIFDKEKGLIDPKSDDQIAAVLGHEMAHATLRHITRRLGTMQGLGIVGSIASVALGEGVGLDARKFFDQVYSFGVNLYLPNYSRKHEAEADRAGFYYLAKAGYNPQAAIDIWTKAASRGGRNSSKTDFFASHPADGERARTLSGWLTEAQEISAKNRP